MKPTPYEQFIEKLELIQDYVKKDVAKEKRTKA
jgi:hypothetical protein